MNQPSPEIKSSQVDLRIDLVHDLKSFQSCVDLQIAVWGYSDGDVIPRNSPMPPRKYLGVTNEYIPSGPSRDAVF